MQCAAGNAIALLITNQDGRDRRMVNARITVAGLRVVERASQAARLRLQTALRPLGPRKLGTLADLLELVRGSVDPDASSSKRSHRSHQGDKP